MALSVRFFRFMRGPLEACLVSVDDAGLRMRRISQRLAEQAFGRSGIANPESTKSIVAPLKSMTR